MSRKILFARFHSEWPDRGFNLFLQINQQPFLITNSNPDDPGRMRVREKADALSAHLQWPGAPANGVDRFLQLFQTVHVNIAQKPEREMELIRSGPTSCATRRQRLHFLLNADDFIPNRLRNRNRNEQSEFLR